MRAVRYHENGGPEVLSVEETDAPDPGPNEVRVAVEAAGVNPVDTYFREGSYETPTFPMVPGSDLAGVVETVGPGVERFAAGDRVFGTGLGTDRPGTYAEVVCAPADALAHLPAGVTFSEGAALALVGATAWQALVHHADLEPAETCLVHGGSGGVGHVAVQLADAMGARVTTTASERYHGRLSDLGADAVLDYRREDLAAAVVDAGAPNVVVDTRFDEYLQFDADVAARSARVLCIGNETGEAGFTDATKNKGNELRVQFMSVFNTPDVPAVLSSLADLVEDGAVVPEIAHAYGLEEAAEAQRAVVEDDFFGKLVVVP